MHGSLVVWDVLPMPLFESNDLFSLRRRPPQEKLVDQGFRQLSIVLASIVGLVLLGILLTVLSGAHQAIAAFGLRFITTSDWDPIGNTYGAFTAIYGTLITSILALVIAVINIDPPAVLFGLFVIYGLSGYVLYIWRKAKGQPTSMISTSTDEPDERGLHQ